jgi:hypothetical protein
LIHVIQLQLYKANTAESTRSVWISTNSAVLAEIQDLKTARLLMNLTNVNGLTATVAKAATSLSIGLPQQLFQFLSLVPLLSLAAVEAQLDGVMAATGVSAEILDGAVEVVLVPQAHQVLQAVQASQVVQVIQVVQESRVAQESQAVQVIRAVQESQVAQVHQAAQSQVVQAQAVQSQVTQVADSQVDQSKAVDSQVDQNQEEDHLAEDQQDHPPVEDLLVAVADILNRQYQRWRKQTSLAQSILLWDITNKLLLRSILFYNKKVT